MHGRFKVTMTARQHGLRTIKELQDNTDKMGTIQPPLLIMDLNCIIPDELHLLLRITDRLIRNLIIAAVVADHPAKPLTGPMVKSLITEVQSCGVHFEVYEKNQYEFTSLNGNDRKKLLQLLPPKLTKCQPKEFCDDVKKLWEVYSYCYVAIDSQLISYYVYILQGFKELYSFISSMNPLAIESIEEKVTCSCT